MINEQVNPVVGLIGVGLMGAPMAANLLKAGYRVVLNDVNRQAVDALIGEGAEWADTPASVTAQSDVILTCLPGLAQIEAVVFGENGILSAIRANQTFFEMSTSSPDMIQRIHSACADKGAHMLDAPISGGSKGAIRGRLGIWVGGDKKQFDRYRSVLEAIGDKPLHVGPIGAGLTTKLVNNTMSQATQAAIAEIFVLGVKAGADPLALWQAIRQGSVGRRRTYDGLIDEYLPAAYDPPHAALRIIYKDMMIATELGRKLGVPMRMANLALADIQEAMNRGWDERDCRSVMLLPQERAGVKIKVRPEKIQEVLRCDPPAPTDTKYGTAT